MFLVECGALLKIKRDLVLLADIPFLWLKILILLGLLIPKQKFIKLSQLYKSTTPLEYTLLPLVYRLDTKWSKATVRG